MNRKSFERGNVFISALVILNRSRSVQTDKEQTAITFMYLFDKCIIMIKKQMKKLCPNIFFYQILFHIIYILYTFDNQVSLSVIGKIWEITIIE